jgi:hypothetical protein
MEVYMTGNVGQPPIGQPPQQPTPPVKGQKLPGGTKEGKKTAEIEKKTDAQAPKLPLSQPTKDMKDIKALGEYDSPQQLADLVEEGLATQHHIKPTKPQESPREAEPKKELKSPVEETAKKEAKEARRKFDTTFLHPMSLPKALDFLKGRPNGDYMVIKQSDNTFFLVAKDNKGEIHEEKLQADFSVEQIVEHFKEKYQCNNLVDIDNFKYLMPVNTRANDFFRDKSPGSFFIRPTTEKPNEKNGSIAIVYWAPDLPHFQTLLCPKLTEDPDPPRYLYYGADRTGYKYSLAKLIEIIKRYYPYFGPDTLEARIDTIIYKGHREPKDVLRGRPEDSCILRKMPSGDFVVSAKVGPDDDDVQNWTFHPINKYEYQLIGLLGKVGRNTYYFDGILEWVKGSHFTLLPPKDIA